MVKVSHPLFGNVTIQIRNVPRYKVVIRRPVPWDNRNPGYRRVLEQRVPNIHKVNQAFATVSHETGGIVWRQRLEIIRRAMTGYKVAPRAVKVSRRLDDNEIRAKVNELRMRIGLAAEVTA